MVKILTSLLLSTALLFGQSAYTFKDIAWMLKAGKRGEGCLSVWLQSNIAGGTLSLSGVYSQRYVCDSGSHGVCTIKIYANTSTTGTQQMTVTIYTAENRGGSNLGSSSPVNISRNTPQWYTFTFSGLSVSTAPIFITPQCSSGTAAAMTIYYKTEVSGGQIYNGAAPDGSMNMAFEMMTVDGLGGFGEPA